MEQGPAQAGEYADKCGDDQQFVGVHHRIMPLRLPLGNRQLSIAWTWLLVTLCVCALFVSLGRWQWHRGEQRQQQRQQVQAALTAAPVWVADAATLARQPRNVRVRVTGQLDGVHQLLLDNISRGGKPGYEVLTPLRLADGALLLVNRGWLPFDGYRNRIPDLSLPANPGTEFAGRLDVLPVPGIQRAPNAAQDTAPAEWPRVASFPTAAQLSAWLGEPVSEQVLLLDTDSGPGWQRQWPLPGIAPEKHYSYAIQWWSFAALAVGLLLGLNIRKRT